MGKELHIDPFEYELIEAKLDGELNDEQLQAYRDRESMDPDWKEKVEEVKTLRKDIESYLLKTELKKIHEEAFPKAAPKSRRLSPWVWTVAASVALIFMGWLGVQTIFNSSDEKLFTAYYQTDPGLITAMSGTDSYEFDRGMVDFKEGKYQEALVLWEPLLNQNQEADTLRYFVAMANMELEHFELSQTLLEKLVNGNPSEFTEDAKWYLGLLYLRKGESEKAKAIIAESNRAEAKAILEELD